MSEPRIRDIYDDYRRGRVSFDRVVQAADSYLASYAAAKPLPTGAPPRPEDRPRGPQDG